MKLSFISSSKDHCQDKLNILKQKYNDVSLEEADYIICLGGDGFMLHTLHNIIKYQKPVYGINCGNLGFLMNSLNLDILNLEEKIKKTHSVTIHPILAKIFLKNGEVKEDIAFNEVSIIRAEGTAAHLKVNISNITKMEKLVSDGVLIATPMGSTAYNRACGGPVLPLEASIFALTPINPFVPLNWNGALILDKEVIEVVNVGSGYRKLDVFCDYIKYSDIERIIITKSKSKINLLFDEENNFYEKALNSQFKVS